MSFIDHCGQCHILLVAILCLYFRICLIYNNRVGYSIFHLGEGLIRDVSFPLRSRGDTIAKPLNTHGVEQSAQFGLIKFSFNLERFGFVVLYEAKHEKGQQPPQSGYSQRHAFRSLG